MLCNCLCWPSL